jgi:hypothetical protein
MSYTEFWEGDLSLPKFYREAEKKRQKRQLDDENFHCWLQGKYNFEAFSCVMANAFKKKGSPPVEYRREPYKLGKEEENMTEEQLEQKKENENVRFELQMSNWTKAFDYLPKD